MKKIIIFALFIALLIPFTACGNNEASTPDPSPQETAEYETPGFQTENFHNITFTVPADWSLGEQGESIMILANDGDVMILVQEPNPLLSTNPDFSNMRSTLEGIVFSAGIDAFEPANLQWFEFTDGNDLPLPTLGATFATSTFGDPRAGASFLVFGEEEFVTVYALVLPGSDFEFTQILDLVGSITFNN